MANSTLAVQLYTLRDFFKTPADVANTLKRVRQIGYQAVELAGFGAVTPQEFAKILEQEGLTACSSHIGPDGLNTKFDEVLAQLKMLKCQNVAVAYLSEEWRTAAGFLKFAKEASAAGRKYKDHGVTLGYHNHAFELEKFNGRTGLQTIYTESDPNCLASELDTYWIAYGGGDPVSWIKSLKGRIPLVHFKDMTVKNNQPIMAEVGEGNLNWPAIIKACKSSGVKWHIVEQDTCQRDPFESLAISLKNLQAMGLK